MEWMRKLRKPKWKKSKPAETSPSGPSSILVENDPLHNFQPLSRSLALQHLEVAPAKHATSSGTSQSEGQASLSAEPLPAEELPTNNLTSEAPERHPPNQSLFTFATWHQTSALVTSALNRVPQGTEHEQSALLLRAAQQQGHPQAESSDALAKQPSLHSQPSWSEWAMSNELPVPHDDTAPTALAGKESDHTAAMPPLNPHYPSNSSSSSPAQEAAVPAPPGLFLRQLQGIRTTPIMPSPHQSPRGTEELAGGLPQSPRSTEAPAMGPLQSPRRTDEFAVGPPQSARRTDEFAVGPPQHPRRTDELAGGPPQSPRRTDELAGGPPQSPRRTEELAGGPPQSQSPRRTEEPAILPTQVPMQQEDMRGAQLVESQPHHRDHRVEDSITLPQPMFPAPAPKTTGAAPVQRRLQRGGSRADELAMPLPPPVRAGQEQVPAATSFINTRLRQSSSRAEELSIPAPPSLRTSQALVPRSAPSSGRAEELSAPAPPSLRTSQALMSRSAPSSSRAEELSVPAPPSLRTSQEGSAAAPPLMQRSAPSISPVDEFPAPPSQEGSTAAPPVMPRSAPSGGPVDELPTPPSLHTSQKGSTAAPPLMPRSGQGSVPVDEFPAAPPQFPVAQEEINVGSPLAGMDLRSSSMSSSLSLPPLEPFPKRDGRFWAGRHSAAEAAWAEKAQERLRLADAQMAALQEQLSAASAARWAAEQQLAMVHQPQGELHRTSSWQSAAQHSSQAGSDAGGSVDYVAPLAAPRRTHSDSEVVVQAAAQKVHGVSTHDLLGRHFRERPAAVKISSMMKQIAKLKREVENYEALCRTFGDALRDYESVQQVKLVRGSLHYGRLRDAEVDLLGTGRPQALLPVLAMVLAFGPDDVHRVRGVLAAARQEANMLEIETRVVKSNMDVVMQNYAVAACTRALDLSADDGKIADHIGSHFNEKFPHEMWQCVVGENFGLSLCGEGKEIMLKSGHRSILLWSSTASRCPSPPPGSNINLSGPQTPECYTARSHIVPGSTGQDIDPVCSRPLNSSGSTSPMSSL